MVFDHLRAVLRALSTSEPAYRMLQILTRLRGERPKLVRAGLGECELVGLAVLRHSAKALIQCKLERALRFFERLTRSRP